MLKDSSLPCRSAVDFLDDKVFLQQAAKSSGFLKRKPRKLTPGGFVKSVVLATAQTSRASFNAIALHTEHAETESCSRQNIAKRCNASAVTFMRGMLDHAIALKSSATPPPATVASFARIIIQDGSLIHFHDSVRHHFPAVSSTTEDKAMLRLQFAYDYKTGHTLFATPTAYSHTDTAAAGELLDLLKPGDLCLRDMGYYKAELFQRMDAMGVFYLSRLKSEVKIPRANGGPAMGLDEFLRGLRGSLFDATMQVGSVRGFATRLVALRVPAKVAAERRRKLYEELRRKKQTPSALRLALADWMLFVTNIPRETAEPDELRKLYGLRWHVELVFKALKSNGCLKALAAHASNPHHLEVLLLGQLLHIVLNLRLWRILRAAKPGVQLSLLKIAAMTRETLTALWLGALRTKRWNKHVQIVLYRCRYDKRRRRNLEEFSQDGLS